MKTGRSGVENITGETRDSVSSMDPRIFFERYNAMERHRKQASNKVHCSAGIYFVTYGMCDGIM